MKKIAKRKQIFMGA